MKQEIIDLYNDYIHGPMSRGAFIKRLTLLAGGAAGMEVLLPLLLPDYIYGQQVPEKDKRLETRYIQYSAAKTKIRAYLARPVGKQKLPAVIVIHENRGLNPHIEDVARRAALAGYLVIAPDALSLKGGAPADADQAKKLIRSLDRTEALDCFVSAVSYLKRHPSSTGKIGCVGFCWGGMYTNLLAARSPDLLAAAPFYGRQPPSKDVSKIQAAMLIHHAANDPRTNKELPRYETDLKKAGKNYKVFIYPDTQHGFHNDTSQARYNQKAAKLAWKRTIAFFDKNLKTP